MEPLTPYILAIFGWMALVVTIRWLVVPSLARVPGNGPLDGFMWRMVRVYCRVVHRVRFSGLEGLRDQADAGPMVVVSNHTGAVDPLLIVSGCRFPIRWMMASDMMSPVLDWLWKLDRMIPVDRDGRDTGALREAIRHVKGGGVIGIFPEGRIAVPPRELRPFHSGVGLIVARTGAPVLLAWITGTPDTNKMMRSLTTFSRANVQFLEVMRFEKCDDAPRITARLRDRLAEVSGWKKNDEPVPESGEEGKVK